jgi:hypothetical protein
MLSALSYARWPNHPLQKVNSREQELFTSAIFVPIPHTYTIVLPFTSHTEKKTKKKGTGVAMIGGQGIRDEAIFFSQTSQWKKA